MYLPVARQDSADRFGGVLVNNMDNTLTGTVIDIATTATQLQLKLSMRLTACIHPIFTFAVSNSASWAWASVSCHVASCSSSPEFDNLQSTTLLPTQLPPLAYYLHTAASQPGQLTLSFGCGDVVFIIFILFVRYLDNWCAMGFPVLLKHLIIIHNKSYQQTFITCICMRQWCKQVSFS